MINITLSVSRELRFKAIELLAFWEGAVNATHLSRLFGVTVNNITKELVLYREYHPGSLFYNRAQKRYEPCIEFECHYICGQWHEYEQFLNQHSQVYKAFFWQPAALDTGPVSRFCGDPKIIREITQAIRARLRLNIHYFSTSTPEGTLRIIHPLAIANSGLRWHCRAFDELTMEFRDFHLGRIARAELVGKSEADTSLDVNWHTFVDLVVAPHPNLSPRQQRVVMMEHGGKEVLTLSTRACLADYILQFYQIGKSPTEGKPESQPLYLLNIEDVQPYLF